MSGRRHRSNCELVAQGVANIAAPLFGGFCVTGNIARTATNVRSGARGPVSGMLHSAGSGREKPSVQGRCQIGRRVGIEKADHVGSNGDAMIRSASGRNARLVKTRAGSQLHQ